MQTEEFQKIVRRGFDEAAKGYGFWPDMEGRPKRLRKCGGRRKCRRPYRDP